MQVVLIIVTLLGLAYSRFSIGKCDEPKLVENFDVNSYIGTWYEIYRDPETPFEKNGICVTAQYSFNADGTLGILNSQLNT